MSETGDLWAEGLGRGVRWRDSDGRRHAFSMGIFGEALFPWLKPWALCPVPFRDEDGVGGGRGRVGRRGLGRGPGRGLGWKR